ncbi:MAG: hypothetical protein COT90_02605 [Candidatus Diapherotrites archaeon CG10_big_fil_rev_8_21_14_0_10_31_34]|nr:MAG: hypothetical protein COT90_02605 [Candidatus Diapherotrites archaeon CG10_big_fil_rev_8_21_14_0_10_31_34]
MVHWHKSTVAIWGYGVMVSRLAPDKPFPKGLTKSTTFSRTAMVWKQLSNLGSIPSIPKQLFKVVSNVRDKPVLKSFYSSSAFLLKIKWMK